MSDYYNLIPGVNYRQPSSGPLTYDWVHPDQPATCAELSDFEVARRVRMLMRNQLDFENVCVMARDRIMALSKMVARQPTLEEMLEVIEPFARFADERALEGGDNSLFYGTKDGRGVKNGDFRKARAFRDKIKSLQGNGSPA